MQSKPTGKTLGRLGHHSPATKQGAVTQGIRPKAQHVRCPRLGTSLTSRLGRRLDHGNPKILQTAGVIC